MFRVPHDWLSGGKVGPDLTKVGQVRTERDLLEAIVYPSASFVRSYEPLVIATKSGDVHNGVVRQENDDEILLATGPRTEVRIAQDDIKEMRPGTVSVMPAGLEEQISRQELTDLLAFLKGNSLGGSVTPRSADVAAASSRWQDFLLF